MNTIAERLVFLRGSTTQADFADRMGINVNTLRAYEKGRALPGYEVLESLCVKVNVAAAWILTGDGPVFKQLPTTAPAQTPSIPAQPLPLLKETPVQREMPLQKEMPPLRETSSLQQLPTPKETPPSLSALSEPEQSDVDLLMIPMVEARLSAGHGSLEVSASSERSYAFRSDFLLRKGNPQEMVLMRVSGDSMEPEIRDNDVVLIDQGKRDVTPGRLYAVGFDEAIYLKRIDVLPGKVLLRSTNAEYPPVELDTRGDFGDQFRVIGRILWCGREYK